MIVGAVHWVVCESIPEVPVLTDIRVQEGCGEDELSGEFPTEEAGRCT